QSLVLLGDLPLSTPDTGPFDLALLDATAFERVEVYRGGAPAWLGSGAVGGVIRLVPPAVDEAELRGRITVGSFGLWRLGLGVDAAPGDARLSSVVSIDGARNDFPFRDDGGTSLDPTDDGMGRRRNADSLGGFSLSRLALDVGGAGRFTAVALATARRGGDPGPAQTTAEETERRDGQTNLQLAYDHRFDRGTVQLALGGGHRRRRVSDPLGEIGLDRNQSDDLFLHVNGRLATVIRLTDFLEATGVTGFTWATMRPEDRFTPSIDDSFRRSLHATGELRAHGRIEQTRFELRASARLEHNDTDASWYRLGSPQGEDAQHLRPTFRVAAAASPLPWLSLVGSLSSGTRFPSFLELFGNGSAVLGNAALGPEVSRTADAGLVLRGGRGSVEGQLEARFFDVAVSQVIRPRPTSQFTVRFENDGRVRNRGLEVGGRGAIGPHLTGSGALTWLQSRTDDGTALPWQPALTGQGELAVHTRALGRRVTDLVLVGTIVHRGRYFNDPANLVAVPARTWVGAGLRLDLASGLSLLLTGRDLGDVRGQDFLGFPLPGRRLAASLRYRMDL
ncbi:MAG TPA: TonB-dependent receptor, partial [Polyangiaceae bacterium LLY-WYZ-14_1]|nr:TonB-dependent receptor [Polyangiaceae bacterium LLY-WYZ-14_1]